MTITLFSSYIHVCTFLLFQSFPLTTQMCKYPTAASWPWCSAFTFGLDCPQPFPALFGFFPQTQFHRCCIFWAKHASREEIRSMYGLTVQCEIHLCDTGTLFFVISKTCSVKINVQKQQRNGSKSVQKTSMGRYTYFPAKVLETFDALPLGALPLACLASIFTKILDPLGVDPGFGHPCGSRCKTNQK